MVVSFQSNATTASALCDEVKMTNGCMGSVNLTASSLGVPAAWWNFLYIPHRFGGALGGRSGDNTDYGTLLLFGMTNYKTTMYHINIASNSYTNATAH